MIINPYNVNEKNEDIINEEYKGDIIQNSISFLITNHKEIIEHRKENEICEVLAKYYFSHNKTHSYRTIFYITMNIY